MHFKYMINSNVTKPLEWHCLRVVWLNQLTPTAQPTKPNPSSLKGAYDSSAFRMILVASLLGVSRGMKRDPFLFLHHM